MMPAVTEWPRPNGIADRDHPVADPALVGIAELGGRQRLLVGRLDLEHGDVDPAVGADQLGLELGVVAQDHRDVLGALDDVVVGEDVALAVDDEARAQRGAAAFCCSPPLRSKNSLNSSSNGEPAAAAAGRAAAAPAAARSAWW
jgi:hypothetical protein